jgi:hypothetical protein
MDRVSREENYARGYYRDSRCVGELHSSLLRMPSKGHDRPADVSEGAVYVPVDDKIGFWTKCSLAADRAIVCSARGPKGEEFSHIYESLPQIKTDADLAVHG